MALSDDDPGALGRPTVAGDRVIAERITVIVSDLFPLSDGAEGAEPNLTADVFALRIGPAGMVGMAAKVPLNGTVDAFPPIDPEDKSVTIGSGLAPFIGEKAGPAIIHQHRIWRNVLSRKETISVNGRRFGENPMVVVPFCVRGIPHHPE